MWRYPWGGGPKFFISEMTIQGSVYVQNLMENETIKSDFEFAHIRHTYGTFFDIWAKFPRFWPNFQRFRFSLLRGARANILKMTANRIWIRLYKKNLYWVISHGYMTSKRYCTWFWVIWSLLYRNPQVQPSQGHIWGAEISTISQKFLDIHIRIKIPNIFHIHHFLVYDLDHGHNNGGPPPVVGNALAPFTFTSYIYILMIKGLNMIKLSQSTRK